VTVCTTTVVLLPDTETVPGVLLVRLVVGVNVVTPVDCVGGRIGMTLGEVAVLVGVICEVVERLVEVDDLVPVPVDVADVGELVVVEVDDDPLDVVPVEVLVLLPVPVFGMSKHNAFRTWLTVVLSAGVQALAAHCSVAGVNVRLPQIHTVSVREHPIAVAAVCAQVSAHCGRPVPAPCADAKLIRLKTMRPCNNARESQERKSPSCVEYIVVWSEASRSAPQLADGSTLANW